MYRKKKRSSKAPLKAFNGGCNKKGTLRKHGRSGDREGTPPTMVSILFPSSFGENERVNRSRSFKEKEEVGSGIRDEEKEGEGSRGLNPRTPSPPWRKSEDEMDEPRKVVRCSSKKNILYKGKKFEKKEMGEKINNNYRKKKRSGDGEGLRKMGDGRKPDYPPPPNIQHRYNHQYNLLSLSSYALFRNQERNFSFSKDKMRQILFENYLLDKKVNDVKSRPISKDFILEPRYHVASSAINRRRATERIASQNKINNERLQSIRKGYRRVQISHLKP